jgi:hypothetical protein
LGLFCKKNTDKMGRFGAPVAVAGRRQHCAPTRRVRSGRQASAIKTTGGDSRLSWRTLSRALASARLSPPGTAFSAFSAEKKSLTKWGRLGLA